MIEQDLPGSFSTTATLQTTVPDQFSHVRTVLFRARGGGGNPLRQETGSALPRLASPKGGAAGGRWWLACPRRALLGADGWCGARGARGTRRGPSPGPHETHRQLPRGQCSTGRNLKEWLKEQFCDQPIEQCQDTRLHDAAYVGDLPTIQKLLQEDNFQSRINEKSVWSCGWLPCTPLRIAATAGHGHCVDFLLQNGAEIDLVDVKGQTALYVAVVHGHLECVRILLEAGADPNGSHHHRSTPVYHAARVGRADILKELIKYGANVDVNHHVTSATPSPSFKPLTCLVVCPLYISAAYHNLECFKVLLEAGANPDFNCCGPVDIQNFSRGSAVCIMDAVLRHGCDKAFVSLLIDFGANLNLVKWETLEGGAPGRFKVNSEGMQLFKEARSCPRRLMSLCRVAVRRGLGKCRLHLISALPVPDSIKKFLLHEQ